MARKYPSTTAKEAPANKYDTPENLWRAARILASNVLGYYAPAIHALIYHESPGIGTMATDKWWRCYVDPDKVIEWVKEAEAVSKQNPCASCGATEHFNLAYVAGVIVHEANHPMRKHHARMDEICGMNKVANLACDLESNDDLMESFRLSVVENPAHKKLCIPPKYLCIPSKYQLKDDQIAESYYYDLLDKAHEEMTHSCGSGATGVPENWEIGSPEESGEIGISDEEASDITQEVAQRVRDCAGRGNIPDSLVRWADSKLATPKYDWRKVLPKAIRRAIHMTHGYQTPSYRKFHRDCAASNYDVISPSTQQPQPLVGIIRDSSGSMGVFEPGEGIYEATVEAEGICKASGARVEILDVSCVAHENEIREVCSLKNLKIRHGGGTDMRVGIEVFRRRRKKPDVLFILTDGFTDWPVTKPKEFKIIIGLVGKYQEHISKCPSWATVVKIENDGKVTVKK